MLICNSSEMPQHRSLFLPPTAGPLPANQHQQDTMLHQQQSWGKGTGEDATGA